MRKINTRTLLSLLVTLAATAASAQAGRATRGDCTPTLTDQAARTVTQRQPPMRHLRAPNNNWNPATTYRQMVILVSYADRDFASPEPNQYYQRIFNEPGYNEGAGPGCVADYFREQSAGLFNIQFDIYGPYKTTAKAQPHQNPTAGTRNYGSDVMRQATTQLIEQNPTLDCTPYDWDGDGRVDQVIYIYAGLSGNQGGETYGYVWPNTSTFSPVTTPSGHTISDYSCSAEQWTEGQSSGIGTICHEFCHCLGLPDIYPTGGSSGYYSVADEWDLMDGGNFTNHGWCPPNFTPLEKILMGWLTPTELNQPATVKNLKATSEGGETYLIHHTDNEYLLLENRQQTGWDAGVPGKGLLVYHVDYDATIWARNTVNNTKNHFRFDILHADRLDYEQWDIICPRTDNQYAAQPMMNNLHLSTSPYPWATDSTDTVNRALTDDTNPAATMYNPNAEGKYLLGKPVTNITMTPDGKVSFDFMGGDPTAAQPVSPQPRPAATFHSLTGQRLAAPTKGLVISNGKKYITH